MKKTKKVVAFALTASMVLGSSMTVFASDTGSTTPVTTGTGNTSGTGTVEGHVNKEVLNVVLPTVQSGSSAFAYTMDPERLIQGTDAAKYAEGTVFPKGTEDKGVYFLTAEKTYANTSNTYQVINKSSCDVTLTVDVIATQKSTNDITLANSATVSTTDPELYLGLKVGDDTKVVSSTKQTVTKTIPGTSGNFSIAVQEKNGQKEYTYKEKADASKWKAMNISMTGEVSKVDIGSDTTAPTIDVTWTWVKAADGATAATDVVDYVTGPQISVTPSGLITLSNLTSERNHRSVTLTINGATHDINVNPVDWDTSSWSQENGGTSVGQLGTEWMRWLTEETDGTITLTLNLTDGTSVSCTQTITK